jgi:integrase
MPRRLPKGCVEDKDRHGNIRIYYRASRYVPKVRLRGVPWTPDFMKQYDAAVRGEGLTEESRGAHIKQGTWGWLCTRYFTECAEFKRLDPKTQRVRRLILEATLVEPWRADTPNGPRVGDAPLERMTRKAVEVLRDRKIDKPEGANGRLKAMRQVFKWAIKQDIVVADPTRDVGYFHNGSAGFHTWSAEEVARFQEHFPIGTKARLAFDLLLFTGQRRSDVIRFGQQHIRNGLITFVQHKGRNRKPKQLTLPILPALQATLDRSPLGRQRFLETDLGHPFTDAGFGNKFRDWCDRAGLRHCTAHGLRKAGATIAANAGATPHQLMAIFGWGTLRQAEVYTRAASQQRLAAGAMHLLAPPVGPTLHEGGTNKAKKRIKSMAE